MNKCIVLIFFLLKFLMGVKYANAQETVSDIHFRSTQVEKRVIDTTAYKRWTHVEWGKITNDGAFVSYIVKNDSMTSNVATVLTDGLSRWKMKLPGINGIEFTGDSRFAAYICKDTLFIIRLGSDHIEKIPGVQLFSTSTSGKGWICFKYKMSDSLILYNTHSGRRKVYPAINSSYFTADGKGLILQTENNIDNSQSVSFLDLNSEKLTNVWKGKGLVGLQLGPNSNSIVFIISDRTCGGKSIWLYERGKDRLNLLVNNSILKMDSSWVLDDYAEISVSGKYISFSIRKLAQGKINSEAKNSTVNIWSYFDIKMQSLQLMNQEQPPVYSFVINSDNHHITPLCKENESVMSTSRDNDAYIIEHLTNDADAFEAYWNSFAKRSYYLKSVKQNKNILLKLKGANMVTISPEGKYAIYYDKENSSYFSYEVASGVYRNITSGVNVSWNSIYREDLFAYGRGICCWGRNDDWVLIYDKFDVWKVDPSGLKRPVNITNGYGLRNNIVFNLALPESYGRIFSETDKLIFNAININNKQNGFYKIVINKIGDPKLLTMGNYIYQLIDNPYLFGRQELPVKARDADRFIVSRMSATDAPNYFFTDDFRKFQQISDEYPERKYNWYRTELHTWKRQDGKLGQGVLYKPENFDSLKKYPVIFYYYEKKSFSLNEYLTPESINDGCNINIPTYVSNGYLVFTPDIDYVIGDPMQGTFDAVISAAKYISQLPFVRHDRMGIGGCSFGGAQTNYLITHSNLFAAAYSASSISDWVSASNEVTLGGQSFQSYFENGQGRMGVPLWEDPERYIKNSPIFYVDKVTTPLLLMHTTQDAGGSFSQALELYTALRRLGKKVWLLEYTDGNHGVFGKSAEDYAIRLKQFFDHYLKEQVAPRWMTRGIPAKLKGIDNGFELDSSIMLPENGLLMQSIQK
ncbi:alpha/beta hydrolase family protein [Chitinophaga arvensicola]|uniref:Prolyl oligopeptidase family protein n=1 Tax=Chitinophaga arvensicola TaxID=29529 RepID=A0A1I0SB99_9BACT|nr:prolyl oligopeptidase family serine peptidase [Chitinophaga arvensicola]SEW53932.1 Prolyl oligopeptidase family protein [Chitinophaga arvensicola]